MCYTIAGGLMKRIISLLLALLLYTIPVQGQEISALLPSPAQPQTTTPLYIAMVYHKLAGQAPDFQGWARQTASYAAASDFEKVTVLEQEAGQFRDIFSLVTLADPLIVERTVRLGAYSFDNKGFLVGGLDERTYFSSTFYDRNYAVVIPDLMDYQWIAIEGVSAMDLDKAADLSGRNLKLVLYVDPVYADKQAAIPLDGQDYWLLSGRVSRMSLYTPDGQRMLWERNSTVYKEGETNEEILKLYQ